MSYTPLYKPLYCYSYCYSDYTISTTYLLPPYYTYTSLLFFSTFPSCLCIPRTNTTFNLWIRNYSLSGLEYKSSCGFVVGLVHVVRFEFLL